MKTPQIGLLRIIDAATNRAGEGLRVVEDYVRFVLDDRYLTRLCKELRHDLASVIESVDRQHLLAARETRGDIGTDISTPGEATRDSLQSVFTANLRRAIESLRSLEETSKLLDPRLAARFETLRYRAYTLERAVSITANSLERLGDARLYVLLDGGENEAAFEAMIEAVITGGADLIQLRDKRMDDRTLLERARLLRLRTREARVLMIVNDRADLAVLSDADGVHIGQEELSVKDARTIVGPDRLIGVSTHSLDQAQQAVLDGANSIGVGPTFASQTKEFSEFTGLELLRSVGGEIRLPTFAIGGINLENLGDVLAAGISRIAVSGVISVSKDPAQKTRQLADRLQGEGEK